MYKKAFKEEIHTSVECGEKHNCAFWFSGFAPDILDSILGKGDIPETPQINTSKTKQNKTEIFKSHLSLVFFH